MPEDGTTYKSDYSFVDTTARVAVYDDLLSSPRIVDIEPGTTREYINALATAVYNGAKEAGGTIPFSIILQVSENFIHARFREVVVSVLDGGNTIRFSDQGPGIADKEKAQQPGFSSANSQMKKIIHGVGSGLPIVKEYMETKNGTVRIDDNMDSGAVVTISLASGAKPEDASFDGMAQTGWNPLQEPAGTGLKAVDSPSGAGWEQQRKPVADPVAFAISALTPRALKILRLFAYEDIWGVKDISEETEIPTSSTHSELKKLEEAGIMSRLNKKYRLTEFGVRVAQNLA